MKIQLKRSNVLEGGEAKAPTAQQMEFGELAVNYNTVDPVIFIKDSTGGIIRLTNSDSGIEAGDGEIKVSAGDGLAAVGTNATANQATATERILSAVGDPGYAIDVTSTGIRFGNNWTNIPNLT